MNLVSRPITRATILVAMTALVGPGMQGCYTVGFPPLQDQYVGERIDAHAVLYVPESFSRETYSYRSFGAGIWKRWSVPYGQRTADFAVKTLDAAFAELTLVSSPDVAPDADLFVTLTSADYDVDDQAASVRLHVETRNADGALLFAKEYRARGSAGFRSFEDSETFAQKGIVRSSTDEALRVIFGNVVTDLRSVPR